ncbi:MAG TPA: transposase, partial [Pyrinomonadaceae bacterium]|nr:transposase [Pyrinomonadaceae bacterium]
MKLIAQVKLIPSREQARLLKQTLEQANAACDAISELAWESQTFGQYAIHKAYYSQIREQFGLSAQIVVRCIAKVADAYKLDKQTQRRFKPLGAIAFDDRILTWRTEKQFVNIWTIEGRQPIPYVCGERQKKMLESRQGESDLVYRKGKFFLLAVCEIPEPTPQEIDDAIGVDFGIVNIATDSDGQTYSGEAIEKNRQWYQKRRAVLQQVGTPSAKRRLKKLSGKQSRYQRDVNHRISKELVSKAKDTNRAIAIEELTHIRSRTTVRRKDRAKHSNWTFSQLRVFLTYKAIREGISLIAVDPRNTSRTCSVCGHCEKANRKSQAEFVCKVCWHTLNADLNAARNIRARAFVNAPMVSQ